MQSINFFYVCGHNFITKVYDLEMLILNLMPTQNTENIHENLKPGTGRKIYFQEHLNPQILIHLLFDEFNCFHNFLNI